MTIVDALGRDTNSFDESELVLETLATSAKRRGFTVETRDCDGDGKPDQAWFINKTNGSMTLLTVGSESHKMHIGAEGSGYYTQFNNYPYV